MGKYPIDLGAHNPGDETLPLRIVANAITGECFIRCVGMKANARGCGDEWQIPAFPSQVDVGSAAKPLIDALGHVVVEHRHV